MDRLRDAEAELVRVFEKAHTKHEANELARPVMEQLSRDPSFLAAILERYLASPGSLDKRNYPVVGIPIAFLGLLIAVFSVYSAICAVLTTFGAAVAGHRTKSPYVHLLIGCVAFLIVGSIPFVGGLATFALTMIAVGTLVSTRLAGVVVRRTPKPEVT